MNDFVIPSIHDSDSTEKTEKLGVLLAKYLKSDASLPTFIALYGDLGVGKTAFVRGFVSEISPSSRVKSPTFAIVREYPSSPRAVFHFDMYRITGEDDLYSVGFYDYLSRDGYILVEWSENVPYALPDSYISVKIEKTDNADGRRIDIEFIKET